LLKEKALGEIPDNELCFFDADDDYSESLSNSTIRQSQSEGLISASSQSGLLSTPLDNKSSSEETVIPTLWLGRVLFERLMHEIAFSISDVMSSSSDGSISHSSAISNTVFNLVQKIGKIPNKKLMRPVP
jgi:hypothetical protein